MKINNVYVGGWYQRTMLQLSEIYDFLRNCEVKIKLDKKKLEVHRKNLEIGNISYGVSGEEFVYFTTANGISVKIFEDGLIILGNKDISEDLSLRSEFDVRVNPEHQKADNDYRALFGMSYNF